MHLLSEDLEKYIEQHCSAESPLLAELNRVTHRDVLMPQMLSGQVQGRFLSLISHMIQPQRILEIGTYTGYSGLCLAEGLAENGLLYTLDINAELEEKVRGFFLRSGYEKKIVYKIGNALDIIPTLNEIFDLVFIDADKQNYSNYYDLVFDKLRPGGMILADNVLWSGKVVESNPDKDTRALMDFCDKVHADERVENVIVSIRDGILMARKK